MNLFSTRDETYHRHQKRIVANAYSVSSLLELESSVDSCTEIFTSQLSKFATKGTPMDLGVWLQYYAFDVIGEITFAKKLGFLEQCRDIDGMMQAIKGMLVYASLCGQVPKMHKFLLGNPLLTLFMPSMESWNQVLQFTLKAVNSVASLKRDGDKINAYQGEGTGGKDMMSRWMAVHRDDPERLSVRDIIVHLSANVFVGAATTGIALRAILNFLMRDPRIMDKVKGEIDVAVRKGRVGNPISYRESLAHLPYMTAVIKEALRLHPSTGLIIEREVPQPGATICGKYIPGGTIVGINAWVVNRNARVFHDPDMFIPERWLESTTEKLMEMEQAIFTFGSGPRACVGKNVSFIEMHKIVPQLLREFEIRLNSSKELEVRNIWFVQQEGMICDLVKR
ncbi:Cytochrome P450 E-class group I [Penicillium concentricum]|uniref:Cytochrome P450 E-class group I n=1 Tax=Penicillium concentricum TaxID=293559 RepID=A0A9W9RGY4_9EURO|nr:Cytochrome P450 E-class group I [Penicillium concentricum]KAJ5360020.1 Cytochrome P450 E-class group I [Penicillium concentricum]